MKRIIATVLSNYAKDLGIASYLSFLTAEAFVERAESDIKKLVAFRDNNCIKCKYCPDECDFFYPKAALGITPVEVLSSNINLILTNLKNCPIKETKNES